MDHRMELHRQTAISWTNPEVTSNFPQIMQIGNHDLATPISIWSVSASVRFRTITMRSTCTDLSPVTERSPIRYHGRCSRPYII